MKKILSLCLAAVIILTGCGSESVSVGGSTSVEELMVENIIPEAESEIGSTIEYSSVGSSEGISGASDGTYQIGTASRELKEEEKSEGLNEFVLAYDGIAIIVNEGNPVNDLTQEQVKAIYTGEITNWNEVGGEDAEIAVVSREEGSGTRGAFEEILDFEGELTDTALIQEGTGNVAQTVATNENAIGYVSFSAIGTDGTKTTTVDGAEPSPINVIDKIYTISRPFNMVWKDEYQTDESNEFIGWVQVNVGEIAPQANLIPAQ